MHLRRIIGVSSLMLIFGINVWDKIGAVEEYKMMYYDLAE